MRRHLLGFALFNLIVGMALIVAILTGNFPKRHTSYVYEVSRESCRRGVRQNPEPPKTYEKKNDSIKVTQAVFNEKTGKLNMSFFVQREARKIKAKLVFVNSLSKDSRSQDEIIGTDYIAFSDCLDADNTTFPATVSYSWLRKLKDNKNLYVYTETETADSNGSIVIKSSEPAPILLMNNK